MRTALMSVLLVSLAACVPQAAQQAAGNDGRCPDTIEIRDFAFYPANCTTEVGATLTFVNRDEAPHTATTLEGATAPFDSGVLQQGQSVAVTLGEAGRYPYYYEIHPGMRAVIRVVAAADEGDDTGGDIDVDPDDGGSSPSY